MAESGLVVVGDTEGELVQAARTRARTTSTKARNLTVAMFSRSRGRTVSRIVVAPCATCRHAPGAAPFASLVKWQRYRNHRHRLVVPSLVPVVAQRRYTR
jgi:hypothetical protein